jgi:RecB family exonuclease
VITARRTRLVRVPDLHEFRRLILALASPASLVLVPSQGAAELVRSVARSELRCVTRDQLYDLLREKLASAPRRLDQFERDALAQAAAEEAAPSVPGLSFRLRPGLVSEMLRFYDELRRHGQQTARFEELLTGELTSAVEGGDRGAERLLKQTELLAKTFRGYERRLEALGACDEHRLRARLIAGPLDNPPAHVVVTVADWIADPGGLHIADFDLLSQVQAVEAIDLICTEAVLGSGFHQRIHDWWPGLEEIEGSSVAGTVPRIRPTLVAPRGASSERPWFTFRDREEELVAVARGTNTNTAVVFKRPLPYLYLAPEAFGRHGSAFQANHALPLAAEPAASALDLALELVETDFARGAIVAMLRSPHFQVGQPGEVPREATSALDVTLSERRYLGDLSRLEALATDCPVTPIAQAAGPALAAALDFCRALTPLVEKAPASTQVRRLAGFLKDRLRPAADGDEFGPRELRARTAIFDVLAALATAHEAHHDPHWAIEDLARAVRRWIGDQTFAPDPTLRLRLSRAESRGSGSSRASAEGRTSGSIHLVDDQAAPYGEFDEVCVVGLVEREWPELPAPNIFFPALMLRSLGWPVEKDRRAAADARFLDLLGSASKLVTVSTFTLDEDALVSPSTQLDEIPRARLSIVEEESPSSGASQAGPTEDWARMRRERLNAALPVFHGSLGPQESRPWAVSALETYLGCPFRFFAQHVLKLEEEPDDEEVMDPRRQGQLVHEVFETFFRDWQAAGMGAIDPRNIDRAWAMFEGVVDRALARLPEAEAGLERTRLLGSSAAAGLGEAVFRMEAERPVAVVERLLEHKLEGRFTVRTEAGDREVALKGKADRLDLLSDGSFRLIDYKLGWPPDRNRALQLPIYSLCAETQLAGRHGRTWKLGEAAYLAFKGPKRVVPLFTTPADRDKVLLKARERLVATIDAIERGEFPPAPDDVYRCETCSFAAVCRKDYVGDV